MDVAIYPDSAMAALQLMRVSGEPLPQTYLELVANQFVFTDENTLIITGLLKRREYSNVQLLFIHSGIFFFTAFEPRASGGLAGITARIIALWETDHSGNRN